MLHSCRLHTYACMLMYMLLPRLSLVLAADGSELRLRAECSD